MGILRFLLIVFVCYYIFKLLARFLLPLLVKYLFKKTQSNFQNQYQSQEEMEKKEGEITINPPGNKNMKKGGSNDAGEYVDFEDVD